MAAPTLDFRPAGFRFRWGPAGAATVRLRAPEGTLAGRELRMWVQPRPLPVPDLEQATAVANVGEVTTEEVGDVEFDVAVATFADVSLLTQSTWYRVLLADGDEVWCNGLVKTSNDGTDGQTTTLNVTVASGTVELQVTVAPVGPAGGAVDSVNGQTGEVVLDADDVGAVADDDPRLADARTPTGGAGGFLSGTYPAPGVNLEALQDAVAAMLAAGANITVTYEDTAGTVTVAATGLQVTSAKDQPGGYAGLNGDGQIATSALPALAIGETFTVASQAAMLALDAQRGDVAIRSDIDRVYRLAGPDPTELTDWVLLPVPADVVQSVNGQQGIVVLGPVDVGADAAGSAAAAQGYAVQRANHTGTQAIATVSGLQSALDGKAPASHSHTASDLTSGQLATAIVAAGTAIPGYVVTVDESGDLVLAEPTSSLDDAQVALISQVFGG